MAALWRFWRRCRLQAPSSISNRNRNLLYVIVLFPLLLMFLLIPGGEIANYKYVGDTAKDVFLTTFGHDGDGSDDVIRGTRSVENKVVLLWTGFFESRAWRVTSDPFKTCPVSNCEISLDKRRVEEVDAVMFNARALALNDDTELPEHPPWQVWILHNSEPPYYIFLHLRRFNNVFNWTSWYRADADIFSPYGDYVEKGGYYDYSDSEDGEGARVHLPNNASDDRNDVVDSDSEAVQSETNTTGEVDEDVYRLHDRIIFFASSNCRDPGRRYKKVAQLKQYLPIDEFGDCGKYQCPKDNDQCERTFARYQFVLAFENGYCRDYITEKLWNAYRRLQIPIVSGGADYQKFAIPGSYIDYDNFSNVENLAAHIHRVSTNPEIYNSYFAWRKYYDVIHAPVADWCEICDSLNDKGRKPQVYKDLEGWVARDSCPLYTQYQVFWTQVYLGMFKMLGF